MKKTFILVMAVMFGLTVSNNVNAATTFPYGEISETGRAIGKRER